MTTESGPFHDGEIAVQTRAGERDAARRLEGLVRDVVVPAARPFLAAQRMLVVASVAPDGMPCASILFGAPGFASTDGTTVTLDAGATVIDPRDPFWSQCDVGAQLGVLAIELASRRRLRVNGVVRARSPERVELAVRESYPNCPKYIQRRHTVAGVPPPPAEAMRQGDVLDAGALALVARADTLFVASRDPSRGADASHRGGEPGFVVALDARTLRIPDYAGNSMFNTLGNFARFDGASIAIPDFVRRRLLRITGHAEIHFDVDDAPAQPTGGTRRRWDLHVTGFVEHALAGAPHHELLDVSPFLPRR